MDVDASLHRLAGALPSVEPVGIAIVADRHTTTAALVEILSADPELRVLGAADAAGGEALLTDQSLRVLIVNLSLSDEYGASHGVRFIREAKRRRPDVGIVSLKRQVDEHQLRAALDAGADACCLAVTPGARLRKAIKVVADGATWLDPEVAHALFHSEPRDAHDEPVPVPHLSPREQQILRLVVEGYSNEEIAQHLQCAYPTVRTHLAHLYRKLDVDDRVSAAVYALRHGLT
ncbi:MAG TPA: response regulator transcription factor [Candidatus Acidoferrales bacterium]|nr:response regulator transcription factor [Candidatus Acidoferrales bacterium]